MSNKISTFAGWEGWYALKGNRTQPKKENPLQDYRRGDLLLRAYGLGF
tara:strand:+ start:407 stop:550 length:144 start_codon:yes stop_codon:yes gene_type:complete